LYVHDGLRRSLIRVHDHAIYPTIKNSQFSSRLLLRLVWVLVALLLHGRLCRAIGFCRVRPVIAIRARRLCAPVSMPLTSQHRALRECGSGLNAWGRWNKLDYFMSGGTLCWRPCFITLAPNMSVLRTRYWPMPRSQALITSLGRSESRCIIDNRKPAESLPMITFLEVQHFVQRCSNCAILSANGACTRSRCSRPLKALRSFLN
jgi:hypothetical protein